ncbi:hypothetical protein QA601_04355 [Chitinispirillales bacterium ANBcel5]|uniref:hypothetical protein n=1 Tax=Cellulosispirillum alkaliphilum TaxID=3039283 RepID=UPI002A5958E8|nr:hypothetical protein [Chitinispirillales bacterium ANBcel5]
MKFLIPLLTAAISAISVYYFLEHGVEREVIEPQRLKVEFTSQAVEHRLQEVKKDIRNRLNYFAQQIASDRDFAMRLLAEQNRSAQTVTRAAVKFRDPMGFSLLEILDSDYVILSSGHFPANAGNSAESRIRQLSERVSVLREETMGETHLTLQAKAPFSIADIPFYATGGVKIDEEFLENLATVKGTKVIVKDGDSVLGMDVQSIEHTEDESILLIDDTEYYASSIPLHSSDGSKVCSLIVIVEKQ